MATALTVYDVDRAGTANQTDSGTTCSSGTTYEFANDGKVKLVTSAAAGANITFVTPNTVDGLAIGDKTVAAGTAKVKVWGPFPTSTYNNSEGKVQFTVSADTLVLAFRG